MNEKFDRTLNFICSLCNERDMVYWHFLDFAHSLVNVECIVCNHSAQVHVGTDREYKYDGSPFTNKNYALEA